MSNDISKHYSFSLDVKSSKIKKDKELVFNVGDSVVFEIQLLEDGQPKDLTGCTVDMMVANEKEEFASIIHRYEQGGITLAEEEGLVKIECINSYINRAGANMAQLIISDLDQQVITQKFLFITNESLLGDFIEEAREEISTLMKLDDIVDKMSYEIDCLVDKNSELEAYIDNSKVNINNKLSNLEKEVLLKQEEIDKKINGIDDTVNFGLVKIKELIPVYINGSTTIGFETEQMTLSAKNLVRCGYMVHISGSVSNSSVIQSATSCLSFYQEIVSAKNIIKCKMFTFMDVSVQGKMLTPTVWFVKSDGSIVDNIPTDETNYKILIKANIHKNNIEKAACKLSPLSSIMQ